MGPPLDLCCCCCFAEYERKGRLCRNDVLEGVKDRGLTKALRSTREILIMQASSYLTLYKVRLGKLVNMCELSPVEH
jgi:hypothetical protein